MKCQQNLDVYEESLGDWGYRANYQDMLDDLTVGSGVLIEEQKDTFSFGHLTFQEHLVGEYLATNSSPTNLNRLLDNDWWREPLNFYASIKGDITDLIKYTANTSVGYFQYLKQIKGMLIYAPFTSPGAVHIVNDALENRNDGGSENFE